jgi:hypothetical protein
MVIKNCNKNNTALLEVLHKHSRKGMISLLIYIIAIPLAYISTYISGILIIAVAVYWFIPDKYIEKNIRAS